MKKIDLETHFVTQTWVDALYSNQGYPRFKDEPATGKRRLYYAADAFEPHGDFLLNRLLDLGPDRIAAMDASGIDLAVVSLTSPGCEQFGSRGGLKGGPRGERRARCCDPRFPGRLAGFAA